MVTRILFVALAVWICALFTPSPAAAQSGGWRVAARDGIVRIRDRGEPPRDAQIGETLSVGAVVTTGADSAATLENGPQLITMSANSRMTIAQSTPSGMTRILQDLGSILFQVDRQRLQHFRVETPRLAAVVKGTTFTVTVNPQFDLVAVTAGLVEVRANDGGSVRNVPSGQSVRIVGSAPTQLIANTMSSGREALGGGADAHPQLRGAYATAAPEITEAGAGNIDSAAQFGSRGAVIGGAPAQAGSGAPGAGTSVSSAHGSRDGTGSNTGLVKFIALYLLASFGAGFGIFCAVRSLEWIGSQSAPKPKNRRPPARADAT